LPSPVRAHDRCQWPGGSPSGSSSGADEDLLAIFDAGWLTDSGDNGAAGESGMRPWYPLCDLDGDLVALIDGGSIESGPVLAAEWQYDAYGNVQWGRVHSAHPALTVVHRTSAGVFFDRLDEPVVRLVADLAAGDKLTLPANC